VKDTTLSIRLPVTLVKELRELAQKNHYLDLSEQIRTIIRQKCEEYTEPYKHEVKKMREQLEENIKESKDSHDKEKLLQELEKIITELKK
jgi:metal-responsive CopG/Arc/MetJ family transcriptional regulator